MNGLHIIDSESMFDGIYFGGVTANGDSAGVLYAGYDVFKGNLGNFADYFGPPVFFSFDRPAAPLKPGSVFTISWEYYWREPTSVPVRISVSFDDRQTWTVLADSAASKGNLAWNVPVVTSSTCWFSLSSVSEEEPWSMCGPFTIEGPVAVSHYLPGVLVLHSNTPNPFNPSTTVSFTLPAPGNVSLSVYDITGRKVAELAHGFHPGGKHTVVWNATGFASGVYFCTLKMGESGGDTKNAADAVMSTFYMIWVSFISKERCFLPTASTSPGFAALRHPLLFRRGF